MVLGQGKRTRIATSIPDPERLGEPWPRRL
jgi:hypothetical protein